MKGKKFKERKKKENKTKAVNHVKEIMIPSKKRSVKTVLNVFCRIPVLDLVTQSGILPLNNHRMALTANLLTTTNPTLPFYDHLFTLLTYNVTSNGPP